MHFPITYEYKPDLTGTNPENSIYAEPRKLNPKSKRIEIIIPKYAPFFTSSLEVTKRDGSPLRLGSDYRIHRIMGGLSEMVGQGVGSTIEILNKSLSEVLISYKTLGHFALIDNSVLQTIVDVANDDRIIHWDDLHGKPVVFPPKWHSHGLNDEITGLDDVILFLQSISEEMVTRLNKRNQTEKVRHYIELIKHYIKVNTDMLTELVRRHERTKNSHGLTKKQIGLDKVENNRTADFSNIVNRDIGYKIKPSDFDTLVKTKLPKNDNFLKLGALPLNQYFDDGTLLKSPGYVNDGWVVYVGSSEPVVLGGEVYELKSGSIDLLDITPNPRNKTFYLYVIIDKGKSVFDLSQEKIMESDEVIWVGVVKTSDTKISEVGGFDVFTINGVRVSRVKCGNAIPATSGTINSEGELPWLTRAELGLIF